MGLSVERNRWKRGKGVEGMSKEVIITKIIAIQLGKEELT